MTRKLRFFDRLITALVGLVLIAAGAALLDWKYRWVGSWQDTLSTGAAGDVLDAAWWPWTFATVGVVLGIIGLFWFAAHTPRRGPRELRLDDASTDNGSVRVDLTSVAKAAAADLEASGVVTSAKGSTAQHGATKIVEIRAHLDPRTPGTAVAAALEPCATNVSDAFSEGTTVCRVFLSSDRRKEKRAREGTLRVQHTTAE